MDAESFTCQMMEIEATMAESWGPEGSLLVLLLLSQMNFLFLSFLAWQDA